jgi:hypothetical protein
MDQGPEQDPRPDININIFNDMSDEFASLTTSHLSLGFLVKKHIVVPKLRFLHMCRLYEGVGQQTSLYGSKTRKTNL